MVACSHDNKEIIQLLIKAGANTLLRNKKNDQAIFLTILHKKLFNK